MDMSLVTLVLLLTVAINRAQMICICSASVRYDSCIVQEYSRIIIVLSKLNQDLHIISVTRVL